MPFPVRALSLARLEQKTSARPALEVHNEEIEIVSQTLTTLSTDAEK